MCLVGAAIIQALGLRESGDRAAWSVLTEHLRDRPGLLVLDNVEHLLGVAADVAELLAACPHLVVLATSRAPLRVRGEWERTVAPLPFPLPDQPGDPGALLRFPAVALFVARARMVEPNFALDATNSRAVASVCARLDGLPLAIELAAPLLRLLSPPVLLDRLERRLPLLVGGARDLPMRQRTLRGAIAGSYDLLTPAQQVLFRRLGVFPTGASFAAIQALFDAGERDEAEALVANLTALIEHSLARREASDAAELRYSMLETIREYAVERLTEAGESGQIHRRHARYFLGFAEEADAHLRGADQADWLAQIEREHDHLRAALVWLFERGDAESALRLAGSLGWFWWTRGYLDEGQRWFERALRLGNTSDAIRARALRAAGWIARERRDLDRAAAWLGEALAHFQKHGDPSEIIAVLFSLGGLALARGDLAAAEGYYRDALTRARDNSLTLEIAGALHNVAVVLADQGRLDEAAPLAADAQTRFADLEDRLGYARAGLTRGDIAYQHGELEMARSYLDEALSVAREVGATLSVALVLRKLSEVADARGEDDQALSHCRESLALGQEAGAPDVVASVLEIVARIARRRGDLAPAARLIGAALAWRDQHSTLRDPASQIRFDCEEAALRETLGNDTFEAERDAGQILAPEAAFFGYAGKPG